ncbi:MAG: apolipoprotein N-acyltransferase [Burkholderiaceae bacterium]|nr:apolipoprotein N-acyltransferase [Burkholderiaceae bacterium]
MSLRYNELTRDKSILFLLANRKILIKTALFLLLGSLTAWMTELPYGGWWFLLALTAFFHFYKKSNQPLLHAWLYQLGYFVNALWWIYISLHDVGRMHVLLSIFAVVALSSYLSIWFALSVATARKLIHFSFLPAALASSICLAEWLRGIVFTGFPWAGIAESQIDGAFFGWAPILGGLACTWIASFTAAFIALTKTSLIKKSITVLFIVSLSHGLALIPFTTPYGSGISVELLQGNFPQPLFMSQEQAIAQQDFYLKKLSTSSAQLVVAPETALPITDRVLNVESLQKSLGDKNQFFLSGILGSHDNQELSNSALGFDHKQTYRYDKHHLVPFGEFVPTGFQWFVNAFGVPLGQFKRGDLIQNPMVLHTEKPIRLGVMICYEDVFGSEIAKRQKYDLQGHHIWVNITNLAWFGESQAAEQQLRLARLRSLETGIPTIRATNTGLTGIINERGQVTSTLAEFEQETLTGTVQPFSGKTPYVHLGNLPILGISILTLFFCWIRSKKLV